MQAFLLFEVVRRLLSLLMPVLMLYLNNFLKFLREEANKLRHCAAAVVQHGWRLARSRHISTLCIVLRESEAVARR